MLVVEHIHVTCLWGNPYCQCISWEVAELIFSRSQRQTIWCRGSSTCAVRVGILPETVLV